MRVHLRESRLPSVVILLVRVVEDVDGLDEHTRVHRPSEREILLQPQVDALGPFWRTAAADVVDAFVPAPGAVGAAEGISGAEADERARLEPERQIREARKVDRVGLNAWTPLARVDGGVEQLEAEKVVARLLGFCVDVRESGAPGRARRELLLDDELARVVPRFLAPREQGESVTRDGAGSPIARAVGKLEATGAGDLVPALDAGVTQGGGEHAEVVPNTRAPLV